jgi:hypothetical protein
MPVWDSWLEDVEKRGLPGKEVKAELLRLLEERGIKPF